MNKIILHIPHSSKQIPEVFWNNVCQSKEVINKFINAITDVDTDILFASNNYERIVFPFSRVFCDVEKFDDDNLETMSKFGMGVIYSKTNLGIEFRKFDSEYNRGILNRYYYPYHNNLNQKVHELLNEGQNVVLIDCHSFSKEIIMIKENQKDLPEICIGFNGEKDKLAEFCVNYFKNLNYNVKTNYPYSGSIIPNNFINKQNPMLKSIMIEINKDIYTKSETDFKRVQKDINNLLEKIENLDFS